ncbi:MAG: carbon-nitrogen hydrolase family protein [Chloroflexota bacterium]
MDILVNDMAGDANMENTKRLKIGAFQFAACESIESNLTAIKRGIERAADGNVRLLLTQECAVCGYPPIEVPSVNAIDKTCQYEAYQEISKLAKKYKMYIALGMVTFDESNTYNSIWLIHPDGQDLKPYHKRALWGWDKENFQPGNETGIYNIDGISVGVRICFEIRFPEYFRELFIEQVDLTLVSFADVGQVEQKVRINTIQSHLVSRATENVMYVLSANSTSQQQWAPTCVIDPDGNVMDVAPLNEEYLLTTEIEITEPGFGRKGRIEYSRALTASHRGVPSDE